MPDISTILTIVGGILTAVTSILLGGNIFFIKRLIDKIESTSIGNSENSNGLATLSKDVNAIGGLLRDLRDDVKDLRRIEIEVAVLKSRGITSDT